MPRIERSRLKPCISPPQKKPRKSRENAFGEPMYEQPNRTEHPDQTELSGFGEAPFIGKDEVGDGDRKRFVIASINRASKGGFRAILRNNEGQERIMDLSATNQQTIVRLFNNPKAAIGRSVWIEGRTSKDRTGRAITQRLITGIAAD